MISAVSKKVDTLDTMQMAPKAIISACCWCVFNGRFFILSLYFSFLSFCVLFFFRLSDPLPPFPLLGRTYHPCLVTYSRELLTISSMLIFLFEWVHVESNFLLFSSEIKNFGSNKVNARGPPLTHFPGREGGRWEGGKGHI